MNRRERKHMEKQLGMNKHKKNMTREERFENMRQNIESGRKIQEEMKEVRRRQEQGNIDKEASQRISSIATDLMVNQGIPYVEAQEKAKEIYQEEIDNRKDKE